MLFQPEGPERHVTFGQVPLVSPTPYDRHIVVNQLFPQLSALLSPEADIQLDLRFGELRQPLPGKPSSELPVSLAGSHQAKTGVSAMTWNCMPFTGHHKSLGSLHRHSVQVVLLKNVHAVHGAMLVVRTEAGMPSRVLERQY